MISLSRTFANVWFELKGVLNWRNYVHITKLPCVHVSCASHGRCCEALFLYASPKYVNGQFEVRSPIVYCMHWPNRAVWFKMLNYIVGNIEENVHPSHAFKIEPSKFSVDRSGRIQSQVIFCTFWNLFYWLGINCHMNSKALIVEDKNHIRTRGMQALIILGALWTSSDTTHSRADLLVGSSSSDIATDGTGEAYNTGNRRTLTPSYQFEAAMLLAFRTELLLGIRSLVTSSVNLRTFIVCTIICLEQL